jgi:hypothetical protein
MRFNFDRTVTSMKGKAGVSEVPPMNEAADQAAFASAITTKFECRDCHHLESMFLDTMTPDCDYPSTTVRSVVKKRSERRYL